MIYCIDASALIDLGERHYPERIVSFRPIWECLYDGINAGRILSVQQVRDELNSKADEWRRQFLVRASSMFMMTPKIEAAFGVVVRQIEQSPSLNQNTHRDRFLSGADPWIIALCLATSEENEACVVSSEKKPLGSYGLGAICKHLGVKHMDLLEFFERNNV